MSQPGSVSVGDPRTAPLKDKVSRVLSFLRDLHQQRTRLVRDLTEHQWHQRIDTLPEALQVQSTFGRPGEAFRLEIRRVVIEPCPSPPVELLPMLVAGWDEPTNEPSLVDDVTLPEAHSWFTWRDARARWAENARRLLPVQQLFRQIYEIWLKMERESESWDLVLGDGLLEAPGADGPALRHPILLQRLELGFDGRTGVLSIEEGDGSAKLQGALLRAALGFSDVGLRPLQEEVGSDLRLNDRPAVERTVRMAVNTVFPHSGRFGSPPSGSGVHLRLAPMLLLVRRTPGITEAIDRLLGAMPEISGLPVGLRRVVGEHTQSAREPGQARANPTEILLTKEANADQEEIVRRLESSGAVLVQGPPGTGKTHTIANLIGHLLAHGNTVLVTSHTTKALRVVRDKVVPELQPLCVSVLERDTAARNELEASIGGIVAEFNRSTPEQLDRTIAASHQRRQEILRRIDATEGQIRQICAERADPLVVSGKSYTLEEAARWLRENEGRYGWIPGAVGALQLTEEQVVRLYQLFAALSPQERQQLGSPLPDPGAFADPKHLHQLLLLRAELRRGAIPSSPLFERDTRVTSLGQLADALARHIAGVERYTRLQQQVAEDAIAGAGRLRAWTELVAQVDKLYKAAGELAAEEARFMPQLRASVPLDALLATAKEMLDHKRAGGSFGFMMVMLHPSWQGVLDGVKVGGHPPQELQQLEFLYRWLSYQREERETVERWDAMVRPHGGPATREAPGRLPDALRTWAQDIEQVIYWSSSDWNQLNTQATAAGVGLAQHEAGARASDATRPALSRRLAVSRTVIEAAGKARLRQAEQIVVSEVDKIKERAKAGMAGDTAGFGGRLLQAIDAGDVNTYVRTLGELRTLHAKRAELLESDTLLSTLAQAAPAWASAIRARTPPHDKASPPGPVAWSVHWSRLREAFEARVRADPIEEQRRLSEARSELRKLTSEHVRARAWRHQRQRVTQERHQALVGWVDTIKKIGKGTGARAPKLIAEARRLLEQCRDAVPVWIMPLSRALESYDLSRNRFDVVIIDEASQMDVSGIIALALGTRVIVVGDHEQVSPAGVGERVDQIDALQLQHLTGIPNRHLFDGKTSIYDLARQSFGGESIRLREHFRCARRIIEFSNHLCYEREIVPLRDTSGIPRVPPLVPVKVAGFKSDKKLNRIEAEMAAALIVAMIERPEYQGCTFGAISLVGEDQALLIDQLLAERVKPEERIRRRLLCGTAAQFQGDERHVIVISMVDSGEVDGPLPMNDRPDYRQRLNVAASRAQDQQWVVHSVEPAVHLKPGDLRRRLLEHVYTPESAEEKRASSLEQAESPFEREVLRRLMDAGYDVVPQWEVGAFRIDIVVQGASGRLAVECDGEQFHPPEKLGEDLARQAMLERLGWVFHRIRGATWFRDPEAEWRRLLGALHVRGIEPAIRNERPAVKGDLAEAVIARARALILSWQQGVASAVGPEDLEQEEEEDVRVAVVEREEVPPAWIAPRVLPVEAPFDIDDEPLPVRGSRDLEDEERIEIRQPQRPSARVKLDPSSRVRLVREHMSDQWQSKGDVIVRLPTPLDDKEWVAAVKKLVDEGVVESRGEKRARQYRLAASSSRQEPASEHASPPPAAPSRPSAPPDGPRVSPRAVPIGDPVKVALVKLDASLSSLPCTTCGRPMTLFVGRHGPFLKCPDDSCDGRDVVSNKTLAAALAAHPEWTCATCGGPLQLKPITKGSRVRCAAGHEETWKDMRDRLRSRA